MWTISDRFARAIAAPHKTVSEISIAAPGGTSIEVPIKSGSIDVKASNILRREATVQLVVTPDQFDLVAAPGTRFGIRQGIQFGSSSELVPVFTGCIGRGSQQFGDGVANVQLVDDGDWLMRTKFLSPFVPASSMTRPQVIAAVVAASKPGVVILNSATDTGLVGNRVWAENRVDVIRDLCTDGGMVAHFAPDGSFIIKDAPSLTSTPAWTFRAGESGTLEAVSRERPMDRLFNTVLVKPGATDGSQVWAPQIVQITDPSHPRHPSKIGVAPITWTSSTAMSASEAKAIAQRMLDDVLGSTESLSIDAVMNPALDAGDVVIVGAPQVNAQPARSFRHFLDSFSLDLLTGSMTAATRSQLDESF